MVKTRFQSWDQVELLRRFFKLPVRQRDLEFLTTAEAGIRLGLGGARVRQLADAGTLAHGKPTGGRIYIHWPTVQKALESEAGQR